MEWYVIRTNGTKVDSRGFTTRRACEDAISSGKYDHLMRTGEMFYAATNPVVTTTVLRAYPGWIVRKYQDGTFDATNNKGLSPGCDSFAEVMNWLREEVRL